PSEFMPDGNMSGALYRINDSKLTTGVADGACFVAGVHLPQGVTITDLAFWMTSESGTSNVSLLRNDVQTGATNVIASKQLNDVSQTRKSASAAVSQFNIVDNQRFLYSVDVCLTNARDAFLGARIAYSYTSHVGE